MNHPKTETAFEAEVRALMDPGRLERALARGKGFRPALLPRILAGLLVRGGALAYGERPSYLKFRAVEVIARVPYHSWQAVGFLLMTLFYADERRALRLAETEEFARIAQDNETMHVVVISALARSEERSGLVRDTLVPLVFSALYFCSSVFLYLVRPRWSFELNYLFEQHAFDQYQCFLSEREADLRARPMQSAYLRWYGRRPPNQYAFFQSVRNDELLHRNRSLEAIEALEADGSEVSGGLG